MTSKTWYQAADRIVSAGRMPFPITETMIQFLQALMTEEEAQFINVFSEKSLNLEEIREKTGMDVNEIQNILESLMQKGIVAGTRSRRTGINVYTLMPPFPGLIEFQMMRGQMDEKAKEIAGYIEKLFAELRKGSQRNYDLFMPQIKDLPVPARVVPVKEVVDVEPDMIIPSEDIGRLVDEQEMIALTHCYCRIARDLTDLPCKVTHVRENCLIFGKVADFAVRYNFAREIGKEEAKKILKESEDEGLVHKIFHSQLDPEREIDGVCSCCNCCCGIFRLFYEGALPFHTLTYYLAQVEEDNCTGCGICEERCPMEAVEVVDDVAVVREERCIGCGVCVHMCPEEPPAIRLAKTEKREVFILPARESS